MTTDQYKTDILRALTAVPADQRIAFLERNRDTGQQMIDEFRKRLDVIEQLLREAKGEVAPVEQE